MDPDDLRPLPKAELHQHLDGSVRPATAVELASEVGLSLSIEEARRRMIGPERCRDQAELLGFFDLPIAILQTADALERAAGELVEDLAADSIRYAEIRWAPRLHLERGLSVESVIDAVAAGVARAVAALGEAAPLVALIVTAMRSHPPAANAELARTAGAFGPPVVGLRPGRPGGGVAGAAPRHRLRGSEGGRAPPHRARGRGAGRGAGPGSPRTSGSSASPMGSAQRRIRGSSRSSGRIGITLDLCPTSNVQAGVVASLEDHPLAALHRDGVSVTISTDDLTVTGATLSGEMAQVAAANGLSRSELATIALNAFERAFAPRAAVAPRLVEARAAWAAWRSSAIS